MQKQFEIFNNTICQIYKDLLRIKDTEMDRFDLKATHVMCLFFLGKHPEGLTLQELTAYCDLDKAAVSRSITTLKQKEYVTFDGESRYRAALFLTPKGQELGHELDSMVVEAVTAGNEGISPEDLDTFYRVLTKISLNLKEYKK